jgi:hypothetical protein
MKESPMKIQSPEKNISPKKEDKSVEHDKSNCENPLSEYMSGTNLADMMFMQDNNLFCTKSVHFFKKDSSNISNQSIFNRPDTASGNGKMTNR